MSILAMDIRRAFGANLRRHRLAAGLSQEALAERMGVDRAHVSSMERGQQNVTLTTLQQAAEALGIEWMVLLEKGAQPAPSAVRAPRRRRVISPSR